MDNLSDVHFKDTATLTLVSPVQGRNGLCPSLPSEVLHARQSQRFFVTFKDLLSFIPIYTFLLGRLLGAPWLNSI